MKKFKEFEEEMTGTGSVAGLTGTPPVHLKKKREKDIEVLTRFIKNRSKMESIRALMRKRVEDRVNNK